MSSSSSSKPARRTFFGLVGAGTAVGGAAVVAARAGLLKPVQDAISGAEPAGQGYRLTEHIRKYYRTTSI